MIRLILFLLTLVGLAAGVAASGWISVSALTPTDRLDPLLSFASHRSIAHHAPGKRNDFAGDRARIAQGEAIFRHDCAACHGAPGMAPHRFARGLNPPAPDLARAETQRLSDGELFWVICNGVRATGMPAFGAEHTEEDIWELTAFIRQLARPNRLDSVVAR